MQDLNQRNKCHDETAPYTLRQDAHIDEKQVASGYLPLSQDIAASACTTCRSSRRTAGIITAMHDMRKRRE
eukprot:108654-Pleurochrysis_carterae.AAC.1